MARSTNRSTNQRRKGAGAMNLDTNGRRNRFVNVRERRGIRNAFRRKSAGGMGG